MLFRAGLKYSGAAGVRDASQLAEKAADIEDGRSLLPLLHR